MSTPVIRPMYELTVARLSGRLASEPEVTCVGRVTLSYSAASEYVGRVGNLDGIR